MTETTTYRPMTPGELRGVLDDLGLSNEQAAELIGVGKSTVAHWLVGSSAVPGPAVILLRLLRADRSLAVRINAAVGQAGPEAQPRPRGRPPKRTPSE